MKKLFLIISFAIITVPLYAKSLNKTEEINILKHQIKYIQEDLHKINNKNAKLNATLFLLQYELFFQGLNYFEKVITREIIIFETLYRNKLSPISEIQVKDSEVKESMQKILDTQNQMYELVTKANELPFTILKNNTKIQNKIDVLYPIVKNSNTHNSSLQIKKSLLIELSLSQTSIYVLKNDKQIKEMINNIKIIPVDVMLSFQKNSLKEYEKILKHFNSKYKKR